MTTLPTRSKDAIVAVIAAGMQGRISRFLNFAVGSVFLALAESVAGVALWLQAIILQVAKLTRASTSFGADLDTWMADYGLTRLPASAATGLVRFGRYSVGTSSAVVLVGAQVKTGDGSQTFVVMSDLANPTYSSEDQGYLLAPGLLTVDVPVTALLAGTNGNVQAGAISLISSALPGIDTATNLSSFTNGSDGESDEGLRDRFVLYINSLGKATEDAIGYAIRSLQLGLQYTLTETTNFGGGGSPGFRVVVDDGTGAPSGDLLDAVRAAVDAVRAAGVRYSVSGPTMIPATVSLHVTAKAGYDINLVEAAVTATLSQFINGLGLGVGLGYFDLAAAAKSVPGVDKVSNLILNGGSADLSATASQTVKAALVTVA